MTPSSFCILPSGLFSNATPEDGSTEIQRTSLNHNCISLPDGNPRSIPSEKAPLYSIPIFLNSAAISWIF
jgi:hypothetical protein